MIHDRLGQGNPYRDAWSAYFQLSSRPPRPAQNEPGTCGEQLAAIHLAAEMAASRGCSIKDAWQDARRAMISHVGGEVAR